MAQVLSGSFNTNAYSNRHLVFSWTATQSVANNATTISWSLKGAGAASGYYMAGNFKVVIAGDTVYNSSTRIPLYNGTTVASGTKTIYHNTDGSKSFSASVQAGIYAVAVNCTGSATWELKSIPRAATITSAPNFNDEQNLTVNYSNPAGNAVSALDICITLSGSNDDIAYRSVSKTGSSYTFAFTDAERKILRAATTGSNSRSVGIYLRTTIGDAKYYSKVWKTYTVINAAPTLTISAADTGVNSTALTGAGASKIINGFNVIKVSTGASAKKEATVKSQSIKCGGQTINAASGVFTNVKTTDGKVIFTATDNRNNTVTQTKTFTVVPYFEPTIKLAKGNVSTNGVFTINLTGTFFNGSFGAVANTLTVQYRWKVGGGEWGAWTTVAPITSGNNWSFSGDKTGLDYKETYSVQARVTDSLRILDAIYISTNEYTASAVPAFDWGKNDFKHNTSVVMANQTFLWGTTTDGERMLAFDACNVNNNCAVGWGGYERGEYATHIYGNDLTLNYKNSLKINGATLNDFVVEHGKSGDWVYRKWNSGFAECFCTYNATGVNVAANAMNNVRYSGSIGKALPFTFKSISYFNANGGSTNAINFVRPFSKTTTQVTFLVCGFDSAMTSATVQINLDVKGFWK